ncbi:MAG TPA: hypothetical protein VME42_18650 [Steroidobacteraceae bacterium]|nr:hypothetical protein [Steroidobacteraceae bacterium]
MAAEPRGFAGSLPQLGVVRFSGADALSFLQGQVSNDTRRLADGSPLLAAYSSAQGRVVAVMHLLPHSSGVLAILPRELALPTIMRLRKFVLRAKVKIEDLSDECAVLGASEAALLEPLAGFAPVQGRAFVERDGVGVSHVPARWCEPAQAMTRYWIVRPAGVRGAPDAVAAARSAEHEWRLADVRAGLPQVYAATSEQFVAQMLNLDLLDAISFDKGCYTGQEIIARTQHLGRIKRRMFHLRLPHGGWSIGETLRLTDGRSGRLTEIAPVGEQFEALAVLGLEPGPTEAEGAAQSAVAAEELSLPYRLTPD